MSKCEILSLLSPTGPIVLDSEKILMPARRQIDMAIELHAMTHGSGPRVIKTLGKYAFWQNWKEYINNVANNCDICN